MIDGEPPLRWLVASHEIDGAFAELDRELASRYPTIRRSRGVWSNPLIPFHSWMSIRVTMDRELVVEVGVQSRDDRLVGLASLMIEGGAILSSLPEHVMANSDVVTAESDSFVVDSVAFVRGLFEPLIKMIDDWLSARS